MNYRLSEHAQDAMEKRRISLKWLEKAYYSPEWIEKDPINDALEHRLARIPEFGKRVLRVVVDMISIPPCIVTVFFDRRRTGP